MEKILGIDTGTNSLGWAIVERNDDGEYSLKEHGTNVFQEGVKMEKGIESSRASERTEHRSVRRHYWRRKVRKIRLLHILIKHNLCPPLDRQALREWRTKKVYPQDELFMHWQRTEDKEDINPYHFRHICLTQRLDLADITQRYILGRALYHLNQRRGFLSNRKETTKETDGKVKEAIKELSTDMTEAGCCFLGEYFYQLYQSGKKIRGHYTERNSHYLAEFEEICRKQSLDDELVKALRTAIFHQRPLKSQKQQVGKCTFEPRNSRCPVSHPLYEDYRMYAFINNIKIQTPADYELRPLTQEEKASIVPLFLRKSKKTFSFEDIAKKLAGKNNYCHVSDKADKPYKFNYHMDTTVSGNPVNAGLAEIFGNNWLDAVCEVYTLAGGKSRTEIMNDIWHALFFFDNEESLKQFARERLQLSDEEAESFVKINVSQDYAALSLKAIKKILPYLKTYGLIYSQAVFLANLCEVLPKYVWNVVEMRDAAIENVIDIMTAERILHDGMTTEQRVKQFLKERYGVDDAHLNKLYHPSQIESYPRQQPNSEGIYQLGSPRINSVRNPMAMHSLFRLRKVVNTLLRERKIDEQTVIHIEFSRDLNDANRRNAIQAYNRDNERAREACRAKIKELYDGLGISREPSDTDILKYQLWEEQDHKCIYTGEEIGLADFLGSNPAYDIEHTVPRSAGGDSTKMNLTLCQSRFNREVKKDLLPSQLANHEEILQRIVSWKEKYEGLEKQIRGKRTAGVTTKEAKDNIIRTRHKLMLQRDYYKGKYMRFTMKEVPEGFSRRQGTDISVISRYARLYLKSVFHHVYTVKGIATSDFRKIWGIQEEYTKKERINHVHHCIDAITIGCIGLNEYAQLAQYYKYVEQHEKYGKPKPTFPKPWPTFVDDMKHLQDHLLVAHHTQDNMPKAARRRIITPEGKVLAKGDVARGALHLDTYYGAIERDGEVKYVVRKALNSLDEKDIKKIVDDEVRSRVEQAVAEFGSLKKAVEADGVWMNREKGVRINKVRIFATNLSKPPYIRQHRDVSHHEYKQKYYVMNDRNYLLAIYVGTDNKGREKREFVLIDNLCAATFFSRSKREYVGNSIVQQISEKGYPLAYALKIGTMVLLYEETPEEVWELDNAGKQKRLYKVTGLRKERGRIVLTHHQVAKPSSEVTEKDGAYKQNEEFREGIRMSHIQFRALVAGVDFEINDIGEIKRLI